MIRKIIALCLVLMAVSFVFSGCKDDDPKLPTEKDINNAADDAKDAIPE